MEEIKMRRAGESLDLEINNETHWQDVRERAAIAIMQGRLANPYGPLSSDSADYTAKIVIVYANALVEELKKEYEQILANSEKTCKDEQVTFTCIGKQVTMSVQELINYYLDNECANTAEECNF